MPEALRTYTLSQNARRAAKRAGLDPEHVTEVEPGKWAYQAPETKPDVDAAAQTDANDIPAFLRRDVATETATDEASAATAPEAKPPSEPDEAEQELTLIFVQNLVGPDFEFSEAATLAIKGALARAYQAGQASKSSRKTRAGRKPGAERKPRADGERSKKDIVADLLLRPEGTTTAEILAATDWPSVSVPAQAKAAGLTLRQEKDGKVTRYFGARAAS